jgi:hypothetical protein
MGSYPETYVSSIPEPIAIVGSSCRFPGGADSPTKLWSLLKNPKDNVQEIPSSRFDTKGFFNKDSQHHGVRRQCLSRIARDFPITNLTTCRAQMQNTHIFYKMIRGPSIATFST